MIPSPAQLKTELRQSIRDRLEKITPAVRVVESIGLCDRLEMQLHSARTILFFAPLPDELDVWPLLAKCISAGKTCALPSYDPITQTYSARQIENVETEIVSGKFGVREPAKSCREIPLNEFHLVLVPGLAFDGRGNRLGRGRGFYDRLLQQIAGVKCGVCLDLQLTAEVPVEAHDAQVNFVVTPSLTFRRKN